MIRVTPRATISDEFIKLAQEISRKRILAIKQEMDFLPVNQRKYYSKEKMPVVLAHSKIVKGDDLDLFKTKLRSLSYTSFYVDSIAGTKYNARTQTIDPVDMPYLVGITQPITIKDGRQKWDMGCYKVMVPAGRLMDKNSLDYWQFIPVSEDNDFYCRHPHHHAKRYHGTNWWMSSTCWGSFGPIITSLVSSADIVEIFRVIYIYLGRYDEHSVLTGKLNTIMFPFAKVSQ